MGKLVDQLSESYGFEVAGRLDIDTNRGGAGITADSVRGVDVAIDFSTADAVADTLPRLATHGVNLVVGTTGWISEEPTMRRIADEYVAHARIGETEAGDAFGQGFHQIDVALAGDGAHAVDDDPPRERCS